MSSKHRKAEAHTRRRARHETARREKAKAAQSHRQTRSKLERRATTLQFPREWGGLFQSNRKARVAA